MKEVYIPVNQILTILQSNFRSDVTLLFFHIGIITRQFIFTHNSYHYILIVQPQNSKYNIIIESHYHKVNRT